VLKKIRRCPTCWPEFTDGRVCAQCAACTAGKGHAVECATCASLWRIMVRSDVSEVILKTCTNVTCANCDTFWVLIAEGLHRSVDTPKDQQ